MQMSTFRPSRPISRSSTSSRSASISRRRLTRLSTVRRSRRTRTSGCARLPRRWRSTWTTRSSECSSSHFFLCGGSRRRLTTLVRSSDGDGPPRSSKKQRGQALAHARALKAELDNLLTKPLMVRGVSAKYLTTRGKVGLVDQLVGGTGHSKIFGLSTSSALEDLANAPRTKKQKRAERSREKKVEE